MSRHLRMIRYALPILLLLAAATAPAGDTAEPAPWRAEVLRQVAAAEAPRWDAALPGLRLAGDIATVRIGRSRAAAPASDADGLIIAIRTPGKPHLEGLYLTVGTRRIEIPLHPDGETQVRDEATDTTSRVKAGTYAVVTTVGDDIHVRLSPAFLALVTGHFEIHWVDYYR